MGNIPQRGAAVRPTPVQPRGAVAVPFAMSGRNSVSSERSDVDIVQITPRSVYIADPGQRSSRRPSLAPVAHAYLVQPIIVGDGGVPAVVAAAEEVAVAVVAVPLAAHAAQGIAVARAASVRR